MKTNKNSRPFRNVAGRFFLLALPLATFAIQILFAATNVRAGGAAVDYVMTTPVDPVKPGEVAEFDVTVRNISGINQDVTLNFTVPQFTNFGASGPGSSHNVDFGTLTPGASTTRVILLTVFNGDNAPPDGTAIELTVSDLPRAQSRSRQVVVQSMQALALRLSTTQASVQTGGNFTYVLSVSNVSGSALSGVQLDVPIPDGATFVSADAPGTSNGSSVNWPIGALAAGVNRQFKVTFQASATPNTPLGPIVATVSDSNNHSATASDARAIDNSPDFEYTVTTPADPIRPGDVIEFDIMAHNRANSARDVTLSFTTPRFTNFGASGPGSFHSLTFDNVAPGASQTEVIRLTVANQDQAPPNGMPITLNLLRADRSASISRTVIARSTSALDLQLSTPNATIAAGQQFVYDILAANPTAQTVAGVKLAIPIPAGATFSSASNGGTVVDNVVTWNLNSLGKGTFRRLTVIFQADVSTTVSLIEVEAALSDNANNVSRASDVRAVDSAPAFTYSVTTPAALVTPGQTVDFNIVVHNQSNSTRDVAFGFTVPRFTNFGASSPGTFHTVTLSNVAAGTSQSTVVHLRIKDSGDVPANGTTVTLNLIDGARGASVSESVIVGFEPPKADFNNDQRPDWLLLNPSSRQTRILLMNNGVLSSSLAGPTLPLHWTLIDADQLNAANSADLLLFNSMTRQTAVWYMNGATFLSGRSGPTLPGGYILVLSHDFNGDNLPDLLIYNVSTHRLAVWYLNSLAQYTGGAFGPTLPAGWFVFGVADFNQDGNPDLLIWNPSRGSSGIWYLTNLSFAGSGYGPAFPPGWVPAALDDFNRDGHPDLAIAKPSTHQTAIWYLNNNVRVSSTFGPNTPAGFYLTAPR